jgi:hypothetical protein
MRAAAPDSDASHDTRVHGGGAALAGDAAVAMAPAERADAAGEPSGAGAGQTLAQQCEAAAARGDCATVRQLMDRIVRVDRGYRGRLAKGSAVARCLAE